MPLPHWVIRLIIRLFPNRFSIARLSKIPVFGKLIDLAFFDKDRLIFVPKVVDLDASFGEPESMPLPYALAEHFVNVADHHWIMNFCICRVSSGCKDYPRELGCLFLGEASQLIDPSLGRRVTREEALEHLRKCREAGLVHLVGRNKLDSLWLGVKPADRLLTICNCCSCCCLWKIIPDLSVKIRKKIEKMPGVEVRVDGGRCRGCGACARSCFVNAISVEGGIAVIGSECRGCGRCAELCPNGAISVTIKDSDYIREAISQISSAVDL
ncbi:MAG: 4Fe-4S binding protein [Candidatus Methanosuratincola petrocarbonis]